jgi:hypothetical protein
MVRSRGHMRTHYIARWSENSRSNLRKIAGRIAVAVREDTTRFAGKPMPRTLAQLATDRTGLRCVRGVDVLHGNSERSSLVFDKGLQLSPRPTMESRSHPFAHLDTLADIGQVFQNNRTTFGLRRLSNDFGANLVIDMAHMTRFPAGDCSQQLPCRLRTVALKPLTQCQKPVARFSELSTSIERAATRGSGNVFAKIDAQNPATFRWCNVGQIKDHMQVPPPALAQQLRFADLAAAQIIALEHSEAHRNDLAAGHREQRDSLGVQPKRPRVNVNRSIGTKRQRLPVTQIGTVSLHTLRYGGNCVTRHLRAEGCKSFTNRIVRQVMELDAITAAVRHSNLRDRGTRGCEGRLQFSDLFGLLAGWNEPNRNRALHRSNTTRQVCHTPGIRKEQRFLPGLKAEVSALRIR